MKINIKCDGNDCAVYDECVQLSFDELCGQYIARTKNLIHLFPEYEKVADN